MKTYVTKMVDAIIAMAGLIAGLYFVQEILEVYGGFWNALVPVLTGILLVVVKTGICQLTMKVLTKSISERLKKEAE